MRRHSTTAIVAGMLVLAACSSGHGKKAQSSTTTQPSAASTTLPSSAGGGASSTTAPGSSGSSSSTTRPPGTGSNVKITGFNYVGDSPVQCNAPTQAELKWTTSGATTVQLSLDGSTLGAFPNGAHDDLFALPCDGKSHTYTLKATAPGVEATRTLTVATKQT